MNNIQIANKFCKDMKNKMKDDGVWTSDNLGDMPRSERRAILKVYKKYFKTVKYTAIDGVCKCTNGPTVDVDVNGSAFVSIGEGGDHGQAVKQENMPDMSGADLTVLGVFGDFVKMTRRA